MRPLSKTQQKELDSIKRPDGLLIPQSVVEFASDPSTDLHSRFTWDDTEAAREFRLEQARGVIRVSVTVIEESKVPLRAYVSLRDDRQRDGGGYRSTVAVLANATLREKMLDEALDDLKALRQKYDTLKELAPVFSAVDNITVNRSKGGKKKTAKKRRTPVHV
jgi:hypothetical protein